MARWKEKALLELADKAWTAKSETDALIAECYEYALPDRNPYHGNGTGRPQGASGQKGKDKTSRRVYDSTLMVDAQKAANRIQYELFPIGHQWANFEPGAFVPDQMQETARADLYRLQTVLFAAIGFSNFDLAIVEWLLELIVAGTGAMMITQGDEDTPLIYKAVCQAHLALREGANGKIDMICRKHKMRTSLVRETWSDATFEALTDDEIADDPELDLDDICYWSSADRTWYYDVIVRGGVKAMADKRIVKRTYNVSPWVIARWSKAAEEVNGRSLVMQALPDARVLSSVKSYLLRHAALAIGGVQLVRTDGSVNPNNVRIFPGAVIPVKATGGPNGASIAPLQVTGDINLAQFVISDLTNQIHKIMMNDGMPDVSEGVRSATELLERMKDLQQSLGAPFSRILKEGIIPILEVSIWVLSQIGVIPLAPGQKIKLNGGEVAVKFASPLVQGQSIREVEAARNAMAITGEASKEAVMSSFKVEDYGSWVAKKLGVDPYLVRTAQERAKLQQQVGQALAIQNGAQVPSVGGAGGVQMNAANQQEAVPLAA
jgi:Bacteriophage head to tail connecting protein